MHGDGVWVHGKVQEGTGAERDNGARACTGRCMQGTGAASDNGARGRCTGAREGAGTGAERDNGARGRCAGAREGAGDRGRAR